MRSFGPLIIAAFGISGALAGWNCKCQDPSGEGPQWNSETKMVCSMDLPAENDCAKHYNDADNQCTAPSGCMDSGGFVEVCKQFGLPGAYCWK